MRAFMYTAITVFGQRKNFYKNEINECRVNSTEIFIFKKNTNLFKF